MNASRPSVDRIRVRLDEYLGRNDYAGAERHLAYWLNEARISGDRATEIFAMNEQMGLFRKEGRRDEALSVAEEALSRSRAYRMEETVSFATTCLNAATVYKAFSMPEKALPLFETATGIYLSRLDPFDARIAGLYNNMALALVDVGRFAEARECYTKALALLEARGDSAPEMAITYLNLASAAEREQGIEDAEPAITAAIDRARALLDGCIVRDGNYAFVCEKCATVFGYYGYFIDEQELLARARRIYEGN